jgi:hypothetical protein
LWKKEEARLKKGEEGQVVKDWQREERRRRRPANSNTGYERGIIADGVIRARNMLHGETLMTFEIYLRLYVWYGKSRSYISKLAVPIDGTMRRINDARWEGQWDTVTNIDESVAVYTTQRGRVCVLFLFQKIFIS